MEMQGLAQSIRNGHTDGVMNTTDYYEAILGEVRAEQGRRRWSDSDLARRAGITQPTISRRMSGLRPLTVPELLAVCDALNVSLSDLASEARRHVPPSQRTGTGERWVAGGSNPEPADYAPNRRRHLVLVQGSGAVTAPARPRLRLIQGAAA